MSIPKRFPNKFSIHFDTQATLEEIEVFEDSRRVLIDDVCDGKFETTIFVDNALQIEYLVYPDGYKVYAHQVKAL